MHFVYILINELSGRHYIGSTNNLGAGYKSIIEDKRDLREKLVNGVLYIPKKLRQKLMQREGNGK